MNTCFLFKLIYINTYGWHYFREKVFIETTMNFKSPAQNQVGQFWHGRRRKQFDVRREFGREKCQIRSAESALLHKNKAFGHESTNLRQCFEIRSRNVGSIETIESVYRVRACRYSRLMSSVFVFFNYFRKMIRLPTRSKENVRGNDFYPIKVRLSLYSQPVTWWLSRLSPSRVVRLYHFVDPIFECFTRDGDRVKLSHRWEVAVSFMITRTWYQISICLRLANTNDVRTRKWKGEVAWESTSLRVSFTSEETYSMFRAIFPRSRYINLSTFRNVQSIYTNITLVNHYTCLLCLCRIFAKKWEVSFRFHFVRWNNLRSEIIVYALYAYTRFRSNESSTS